MKKCSTKLLNIDVIIWFINESITRFSSVAVQILRCRTSGYLLSDVTQERKPVLCCQELIGLNRMDITSNYMFRTRTFASPCHYLMQFCQKRKNSWISYVQISHAVSPSPVCNLKVKCPSQPSINDKRVHHIDLPSQI